MRLVIAIGNKVPDRMEVSSTTIEDDVYLEACRIVWEKKNWLTVAI